MHFSPYSRANALPFQEVSQEIYQNCLRESKEYPHVTLQDQLESFAIARHHIQRCFWTDQMAHANFRPLPEDMPPSYGMCVTASTILHQELTENFPDRDFLLHTGRVRQSVREDKRTIIPAHVWISCIGSYLSEHIVIDITADQSRRLPPVVVATTDYLADQGVMYQSYRSFTNTQELIESFQQREPKIQQRIEYLAMAMDGIDSYYKL